MEIGGVKQELGHWWEKELPFPPAAHLAIGVGIFSLGTALGAFVWIPLPFTPVPLTLQTLFVLLSGAFLGSRGGAFAQGFYILMGSLGLPVWAGGGAGLARLWGPTGGYLLAFPLSAWVVGRMLEGEDSPSWTKIWAAFALGSTVIYLLGLAQLSIWLHCDLKKAATLGVLPFLPGDLLKMALASLLYRRGSRIWFACHSLRKG